MADPADRGRNFNTGLCVSGTYPLNRVLFTADKNARKLQTVYEHLYTHMCAPQICLCKTQACCTLLKGDVLTLPPV